MQRERQISLMLPSYCIVILACFNADALLCGALLSAQTEYHVRRALKKADPALPTHAAGGMLQANKLLLHFMPAARTLLIILSHPYGLAEESSLAKK